MRFATISVLFIGSVSACLPSISCTLGGFACHNTCVREVGRGGHCVPNDQCPGQDVCVCDRAKKRGEEDVQAIHVEERYAPALENFISTRDTEHNVLEQRSICCSFPDPVGGLCCDDHCSKIGRPGGQCVSGPKGTVCTCN